ncbi:MAG: adenine nucleotide alpha hydrolase family protein [Candidatus Lokiarchaeota archaeon]|nr:adenine nucleotide alpha hydrolase family protein [Candidatus Harpocratesius repetitus]
MPQCKFFRECRSNAVIQIPHTKMALCKDHFLRYIENRVKKNIEDNHLIDFQNPKEKVLVAISGGKDSQTLLTILHKALQGRVALEALYIEVGITPRNYSYDSAIIARSLCEKLGVPFHILNVKEHLGFTIDDIHQLGTYIKKGKRNRKRNNYRGECSYCGLLKRYYINYFAVKHNFTKVATGHNLTDEASQLLSNFFSIDIELMSRAGPITLRDVEGLIPRIKPLYYIYETELIMYAYFAKVEHLPTECEYATDSPVISVKKSLEKIESFRRGSMMNMVRDFQKNLKPILAETITEDHQIVKKCSQCGMTTYLDMCSFCTTTNRLKEQMKQFHILEE